jgi:t-SNARE complex subunit (syntaxin)
MFNDLNLIVERQGEQIDRIEDLINNTQDYMEKGIKQLDGAKKHQNANRKWICIMLIIAVIMSIIVCIPFISNAANTT